MKTLIRFMLFRRCSLDGKRKLNSTSSSVTAREESSSCELYSNADDTEEKNRFGDKIQSISSFVTKVDTHLTREVLDPLLIHCVLSYPLLIHCGLSYPLYEHLHSQKECC